MTDLLLLRFVFDFIDNILHKFLDGLPDVPYAFLFIDVEGVSVLILSTALGCAVLFGAAKMTSGLPALSLGEVLAGVCKVKLMRLWRYGLLLQFFF
jgi:hypothetical protein